MTRNIAKVVLSLVAFTGAYSAVTLAAAGSIDVYLAVCDRSPNQRCDAPVPVKASRVLAVFTSTEEASVATNVMIEFPPAGAESLVKLSKAAWDAKRSLAIIRCDGHIANAWVITEPDYSPERLAFEWQGDGFLLSAISCATPPTAIDLTPK